MLRRLSLLAALAALLAAGCECGDPPQFDGGPRRDSGPRQDGGTDAGPGPRDAGPLVDGGPTMRVCDEEELCGDGLDADCDDVVDEGCPCAPGEIATCFRGDPARRAQGECRDGMMVCEGSFEFGTWGPCQGDTLPSTETCDASGLDEDCDGAPNDGCECADGDPDVPCGTDLGVCMVGLQRCVMGVRTECEGSVGPSIERCNEIDDDCDGMVDESLVRTCGSDVGVCRIGTQRCVDGDWGMCAGGTLSGPELCDALDNDCDGSVDEMVTRACGTDTGICVAGLETCSAGTFGACVGRTEPVAETCNSMDDDCDMMTDEALARSCGNSVGRCQTGTETCSGGAWGSCVGEVTAIAEACEGTVDEDCDGTVDEGCACTTGAMRTCGTAVGRCRLGSQTCSGAGAWGACMGQIDPRAETCDGTDDDCDGTTDEGCDCITGAMRACGSSVGECIPGVETCDVVGRWGPCLGETPPATEVCNARDDDCDMSVDEMGVCPRFPPTAMCPGAMSTVTGTAVTLNGSGMDPDGGAVSYAWSVVVAPVGSTAAPTNPTSATTSFNPDVAGSYTLRLCVTDDEMETTCCTVSLTVASSCSPPTAPTLTVCPTSWDRRPVVEMTPLPSGQTYQLFYEGSSYATVSMVGQNYHRPATALAVGGPPPGVSGQIYARACLTSDPTCCANSAPVMVSMVEACTTPVAPTPSNIVFSEYVTNGDGACPGPDCEAGEAIEITNLSHCPVSLDGHHFGYCNPSSCSAFRWMDFGPAEVIPPRGVYVAIRNQSASMCSYPFFGPNDPSLFGIRISSLSMMGSAIGTNGWFENGGGGMSRLRIATGPWSSITSGTTVELISPYLGAAGECQSIGFDAVGQCGEISAVATPTTVLTPNQLGRLWHPCDAVVSPVPSGCM